MTDTPAAPPADRSPKSRVGTTFAGEFNLLKFLGRGDVDDALEAELRDGPGRGTVRVAGGELAEDRGRPESLLREGRGARAVEAGNVAQAPDADICPEDGRHHGGEY